MKMAIYFIIFLLVSFAILLLCAYKIRQWFKKENVTGKWQALKAGNELYALRMRIERLRVINLVVFFLMFALLFPLARTWLDEGWQIAVPIVVVCAAFWANNRIVTSLWRCSVCQQELPRLSGRSSLRPQMVDNCPHCGHGFIVDKKASKGFFS